MIIRTSKISMRDSGLVNIDLLNFSDMFEERFAWEIIIAGLYHYFIYERCL